MIANGPICGITAYPGSGKATVVTLSPLTGNVIDSNVGGYFAPFLKFSGFDALEIQGKAKEDVILFIDGDTGQVIDPFGEEHRRWLAHTRDRCGTEACLATAYRARIAQVRRRWKDVL